MGLRSPRALWWVSEKCCCHPRDHSDDDPTPNARRPALPTCLLAARALFTDFYRFLPIFRTFLGDSPQTFLGDYLVNNTLGKKEGRKKEESPKNR